MQNSIAVILASAAILAIALAFIPRGQAYDPIKRIFDLGLALIASLAFSPIILAAALAIKLESRGPVFYLGDRVGAKGRRIQVWKLRSMVVGADRSSQITGVNDPRVTGVGRLLRATKIDELPQLFNVLLGNMSIVGPRPESSALVERYYRPEDRELFDIAPGLTCSGTLYYYLKDQEGNEPPAGTEVEEHYAQVNLRPKLAADLHYVRNRSLAYDIRLIGWTMLIIASRLVGARLKWLPDNMRDEGSAFQQ